MYCMQDGAAQGGAGPGSTAGHPASLRPRQPSCCSGNQQNSPHFLKENFELFATAIFVLKQMGAKSVRGMSSIDPFSAPNWSHDPQL